MRALLLALLVAAPLAGCLEPQAPPSTDEPPAARWRLHGTFTTERTDEDMAEVCRIGTGNASCALMESFPEQYAFVFPTRDACEDARARIAAVPNARPGACVALEASGEPDAPTSSEATVTRGAGG